MEVKKAIFLDKDGTLIVDIPYNVDADLVTLNAGVIEGLCKLKDDFTFYVISNQSGIAKKYFDSTALRLVEQRLDELLLPHGIKIERFYYCPHDLKNNKISCACRKPKPGLLLKAAKENGIDLASSYMIGDILNDVEAGKNAGCKSILIDNGNETLWQVCGNQNRIPNYIATNFLAAADYILTQETKKNTYGYELPRLVKEI